MSPRTKEQFEAIRNEKEKLILEVALSLFAKNGFESTSVSMIAKKAGISKGLMYSYFKSKEDLLKEIILDGLNRFIDFLKIEDPNNIQKQELINFIDGNFSLLKSNSDFYKLYFSLSLQPKVLAVLEAEIATLFGKFFSAFNNYFEKKGDKNPYVKTRYLLAIFDGVGLHYLVDTKNYPLDETRDMIVDLL